MKKVIIFTLMLSLGLNASAQRKTEIVQTPNQTIQDDGMVLKRKVAIGRFSNETQYAKGIFYDKENDPMGKQALDILLSLSSMIGTMPYCLQISRYSWKKQTSDSLLSDRISSAVRLLIFRSTSKTRLKESSWFSTTS